MSGLARVQALVEAAHRLADPSDELGRRARAILPGSTGLSPQNVELCLAECLETHPSAAELESLSASVVDAPRAWVSLAATVFVAPLRAIALALAQSERVVVRASRREPEFCRLLHEASGAFDLVDAIEPAEGDHVWLYGSDATIAEMRKTLRSGVTVYAHGSGIGIAIISERDLDHAARALAADVVPFDQRGCLSPRLVFVLEGSARRFAETLAAELDRCEQAVPLGQLTAEESAEITRFRDAMRYGAELFSAGRGFVSVLGPNSAWHVPPVGRNVTVIPCSQFPAPPRSLADFVAAVGLDGNQELEIAAARSFPRARRSPIGRMQRPTFDGPVDLRPSPSGEIV